MASEGSASASLFPPIADYGFLSNCEQSCLVAPDGSVEWLCLPRPDSPSVLGALLDRAAGEFRFGPTSAQAPHHRRYVPGTMVLETTWHTPAGWLVVHDLLVMGRTDVSHRRADYRRALTDFGATGVLLRTASSAVRRSSAGRCVPPPTRSQPIRVPLRRASAPAGTRGSGLPPAPPAVVPPPPAPRVRREQPWSPGPRPRTRPR